MTADQHETFRMLFEQHGDAVRSFLVRRLDRSDIDDALATTFLTAWRRFPETPEPTLAWLFAIARRVAANRQRAVHRQHALLTRLAGDREPVAVRVLDEWQDEPAMRAFSRLSAADQEVLALIAWDGMNPLTAATVLGCSPGAVRVRLHRARRRMQAQLKESATRSGRMEPVVVPRMNEETT